MNPEKITAEKTQNCGNCKNFRMHYIKYSRGKYVALMYGHCVKPRLKKDIMMTTHAPIGKKRAKKTDLLIFSHTEKQYNHLNFIKLEMNA